MISKNTQKGSALYLTLLVMAVLLGIGFGVNTMLVGQLQTMRRVSNAALAFSAAEAGVERELFERNAVGTSYAAVLDNGASYAVEVVDPSDPACNGFNFCIKSVGTFRQAERAVWVER